jgi:hypothetical protein
MQDIDSMRNHVASAREAAMAKDSNMAQQAAKLLGHIEELRK